MVTGRPCFPLQLFDLGVGALNKQHSRRTVSAFLFYIRITLQPQRPIGRKENIRKTLFAFYHEGSFPNVHNWICLYRVILVFIFLPHVSLYLDFALFFQIHTSIYSSGHSRTGWKAFGHVQLSHKRRSVAGMLITHWTTQCIIVERVHRTKVCKVWTRSRCILYKTVYRRQMLSEVILVISRSNYGFTFVRFC